MTSRKSKEQELMNAVKAISRAYPRTDYVESRTIIEVHNVAPEELETVPLSYNNTALCQRVIMRLLMSVGNSPGTHAQIPGYIIGFTPEGGIIVRPDGASCSELVFRQHEKDLKAYIADLVNVGALEIFAWIDLHRRMEDN